MLPLQQEPHFIVAGGGEFGQRCQQSKHEEHGRIDPHGNARAALFEFDERGLTERRTSGDDGKGKAAAPRDLPERLPLDPDVASGQMIRFEDISTPKSSVPLGRPANLETARPATCASERGTGSDRARRCDTVRRWGWDLKMVDATIS